ncbi:MAG: T9SS type A sorting domain-containing protein, partial [Bacteroidota bacterium]
IVLLSALGSALQAQFRYIEPIFSQTEITTDTFGSNIDPYNLQLVVAGVPEALAPINRPLPMDVYEPLGDTVSLRPVVVIYHGGNFLPQFVNNSILGTRKDSAVVEFMHRFAERGYVGIAASNRVGWDPTAPDPDVRTSTLLQAAYRGGQDGHMMARYLRKTVVEEGNPYRIDTSRIVFMGLGTGGYLVMTHAFLDSIPEILADDRFYDLNDNPYVVEAFNADPQGTLPANFPPQLGGSVSNIPNHLGYNSSVAMSINVGGALGDLDWMQGKASEPLTVAVHDLLDPDAPFSFGNVIVPTTEELVITGASGSEQIIKTANELGINDALNSANSTSLSGIFGELARELNVRREGRKTDTIDPDPNNITGFPEFALSHDNLLTIVREDSLSGLYNWGEETAIRTAVATYNALPLGPDRDADDIIARAADGNPNAYNAASARLMVDTVMAHLLPRMYIGLDLEEAVGTNDIVPAVNIGLEVFPNPTAEGFTVRTEAEHKIRSLHILDFNGRTVATYPSINQSTFRIERGNLPRGNYILRLQLDEGVAAHKLVVH